ncbi:hypothetical protein VF21_06560 [Pseudogymnoascus sp. 05NY08]|nr:hypothetical protein VF21_06560 [Pseudogymnoascus sp. 05NY08]
MAQPSADVDTAPAAPQQATPSKLGVVSGGAETHVSTLSKPLVYSGSLDEYKSFDVTPVIGREYPEARLFDILKDDVKIGDLAIQVSQRGIVFFRNQGISVDDQKILGQKLGELTGKPESSKLHRHALSNSKRGIAVDENGRLDDEISAISSEQNRKYYKRFTNTNKRISSEGWHAEYAFPTPLLPPPLIPNQLAPASGYEAYDSLSPPLQALASSLIATHYQPNFVKISNEHSLELINSDRGSPANTGLEFKAVHPVVRTNPVTGWKKRESEVLKKYFLEVVAGNHDLQVKSRWGKGDVAIWDNRSVFHTATDDYEGRREGNRVVSIGERPFFDGGSVSRREALGLLE